MLSSWVHTGFGIGCRVGILRYIEDIESAVEREPNANCFLQIPNCNSGFGVYSEHPEPKLLVYTKYLAARFRDAQDSCLLWLPGKKDL